jgi:hypothetical protein
MKQNLIVLCLLLPFFLGCQTGVFINDSPAAATDIRKAFIQVMGEPRSSSSNGQELISKFHDKRGRVDDSLAKSKSRFYTKLTILGDRRPFKIKIECFHEVKVSPQQYEIIGEDLELAQKTATTIEEALNQSLKGRNVIDDFRAY